ncbi:MAG: acyltransferase family protein [Paraburkholderia tropica]|nr:acyltransferase family protein [Paraburkholderia tropica]
MQEIDRAGAAVVRTSIYRPDIDGLRALAVVSVLIYHAFPGLLPGGFVGVDVFFVISGYLITGILATSLDRGTFNIPQFYLRRTKRIFPALACVLLFVLSIGWLILFANEFQMLGKDIAAGAAFIENLTQWSEAGYFDRSVSSKPLVHLWSLGVEEQFYFIWPLLLWTSYRLRLKPILIAIGIAAVSFAINIAFIFHYPTASFYSPISRFWELMVGAILALAGSHPLSRKMRDAISIAGLGSIAIAIVIINPSMRFPGWWAIFPVGGAAFVIAAGPTSIANRKLFSSEPFVWIGKISYPLYLWHWPLLSFMHILVGQTPTVGMRIAILCISVLLAWGTSVFIEAPIRFNAPHPWRVAIPCILIAATGLTGLRVFVSKTPSYSVPYSTVADVKTAVHGIDRKNTVGTCGVAETNENLFYCAQDSRESPTRVLWGDSKAEAMAWSLFSQSAPGERWRLIGRAGCAPMTGMVRTWPRADNDSELCERSVQIATQSILTDPHIKVVAIAVASRDLIGATYARAATMETDENAVIDGFNATISRLRKAGKRVIFIIDNPTLPDPSNCMDRSAERFSAVQWIASLGRSQSWSDRCTLPIAKHLAKTRKYREILLKIKGANPDLTLFDTMPYLCDETKGICQIMKNGKFLYSYGDHVSDYGSAQFVGALIESIDRPSSR